MSSITGWNRDSSRQRRRLEVQTHVRSRITGQIVEQVADPLSSLHALDRAHVIRPNHPLGEAIDFIVTHGEGVRLHDIAGRDFLDGRSQLNCANLGYSHPRLIAAIKQQAELLPYLSIWVS